MAYRHMAYAVVTACLSFALAACGGGGGTGGGTESPGNADAGNTSGSEFSAPGAVESPSFNEEGAASQNDGSIDTSSVNKGIVMAHAVSASKLKFVVVCGEQMYNYDLPGDATPIACPINMGNGTYTFSIMRNTGGNNYVETASVQAEVQLESEYAPFLLPNVFCNYTNDSACVAKARELTEGAQNQGDAVRAVCTYIVDNITYDSEKASQLSGTTGYVPNPDETFSTKKGICFDFASLGAAMLRSMGIPTKIVTGYVSPNDLYHAWIMVYIDGSWSSAKFSINPQSWSRVDLTFAADSNTSGLVGDGKTYTDRYVY